MHLVAKKIYKAIADANQILLIPHANPDGDALGSLAACMQYLRTIDKPHMAFCVTVPSPHLRFLPHIEYITSDPAIWTTHKFDLIMVFDSGDLRYAGVDKYIDNLNPRPKIVNIDHHATNEKYGDYNMVNKDASSTTEVLYHFFRANNLPINADIATCLLTGLITDTDNFTNAATHASSMELAGNLIARGADASAIRANIFKNKSVYAVKLWGLALSRLTKNEELKIAHTYLTQADVKEACATETEIEGIANFLNNLSSEDAVASLVLKELPDGRFKGSFRTTRDDTDVSAWAKALNGGGHKKAAGFSVPGSIDEALIKIFAEIANLQKKG